jgi:hypothetical protein
MNSAHDPVVSFDDVRPPQSRPLASWYTQGRSDGIGDRLLMADNTGTAALELLRFRPELAATYGFETALRERVERLDRFRHPAFPQVHAVEYLEEGDGLALVSTHTPGKRVADLFQAGSRAEVHPAFATWLIRQMTSAIADLQAQGHELAHGALTADRIVLTPDRRVVIIEHALGSALESLQLSSDGLWSQVGVMTGDPSHAPRLDCHADVVQIGLVSLSVLLGRPITPAEYPMRLPELLDEFTEVAARRSPGLVGPLRLWLEMALRTDGRGFRSAREARGGLGQLPDSGSQQPVIDQPPPPRRAVRTMTALQALEPESTMVLDMRDIVLDPGDPPPQSEPPGAYHTIDDPLPVPESVVSEVPSAPGLTSHAPGIIAALAVLAVAEAVVFGIVLIRRPAPQPPSVSFAVESHYPEDVVMVDGREAGPSLSLKAGTGRHTIAVIHRPADSAPRSEPASANVGLKDDSRMAAIAQAVARQRSGGVKLVSPIELQVFEGDRVLGTTADGPIVAPAGTHALELVNSALGFRARQTVQIKAGQILSLAVSPPNGLVSVNAVPWAQVWIDGNPVGETPLANLSIPVGEHEIVFRHPQFGERREKTVVKSGALTRVSATLGR